jgi:hypothetical protein
LFTKIWQYLGHTSFFVVGWFGEFERVYDSFTTQRPLNSFWVCKIGVSLPSLVIWRRMKYNIKVDNVKNEPGRSSTTPKNESRRKNNSNRRARPSSSKGVSNLTCGSQECHKNVGDCHIQVRDCKQTCETVINEDVVETTQATAPFVRAFTNSCGPSSESFDREITVDDFEILDTSSVSSNPAPSSASCGGSSDSDGDGSDRNHFTPGHSSRDRIVKEKFFALSEDCDLVVFVGNGNEQFHHLSSIFGDASDYIMRRMVLGHDHQHNFVDFSNHSADGWKAAAEFFPPSYSGKAELSWQVLPIVLPWFSELNSTVLLKDVDLFLLETVVVARIDEDEGKFLTVHNLLIIASIAYRCRLDSTKAQARQWLRNRLQQPSAESDHQKNEIAFSLEDLQLLSTILIEFEELREYLWVSAIITYLPHDLNVLDSLGLVSNVLFPYLLREGMVQVCIMQEAQRGFGSRLKRESDQSVASSSTSIRGNLGRGRQGRLSQDMLRVLLTTTFEGMEKFLKEKESALSSPLRDRIPSSTNGQKSTRRKNKSRRGRSHRREFDMNEIKPERHVEGSELDITRAKQKRSSSGAIVRAVPDRKFAC